MIRVVLAGFHDLRGDVVVLPRNARGRCDVSRARLRAALAYSGKSLSSPFRSPRLNSCGRSPCSRLCHLPLPSCCTPWPCCTPAVFSPGWLLPFTQALRPQPLPEPGEPRDTEMQRDRGPGPALPCLALPSYGRCEACTPPHSLTNTRAPSPFLVPKGCLSRDSEPSACASR